MIMELWQIYAIIGALVGFIFAERYTEAEWKKQPLPSATVQQRIVAAARMGVIYTVAMLVSGVLWPLSVIEVAWKTYKKARKNK
jgi:hypothetical protein